MAPLVHHLTNPSPDARPGRDAVALDRRPIKIRSKRSVQALALTLTRWGVSPNQVSVLSVVFASIGAALLAQEALGARTPWPLVGTAVCIQLRLLANLVDGLIAVEGG